MDLELGLEDNSFIEVTEEDDVVVMITGNEARTVILLKVATDRGGITPTRGIRATNTRTGATMTCQEKVLLVLSVNT